jgi:hypothetical protein
MAITCYNGCISHNQKAIMPLTKKGTKIMKATKSSKNKGTIKGVEKKTVKKTEKKPIMTKGAKLAIYRGKL